jgi:O-antigen ligase
VKSFYTLLFAFSLTLIDPWGTSRGAIWTTPKVLIVLLLCLLNLSILWEDRKALTVPPNWFQIATLWGLFLGIGLESTLLSPFPLRSLLGQEQMGDGWLYWVLIAVFSLSNTLLLKLHPELIRPQLKGLIIGGVIVAISIFPQVIDWRLDYTATMGQLIKPNILASTIFQGQQPIGLYSHRGHAAFVLAAVAVLLLVSWRWGWISTRKVTLLGSIILLALLLTQTRQAIIALLIATAFLLGKKYYKVLIPIALIGILIISLASTNRRINNLPLIKQITSDRIYLWELASRGISKRPLFGWGFDGFGTAYPYILNPEKTPQIVRLGDFSFDYLDEKGQINTSALPTAKAHNFILDTTISVGIVGLFVYLALFIICIWRVIKSPTRGIEAIGIAYFIFTLTWFECAQFSHIAWWALSLWGVTKEQSKIA